MIRISTQVDKSSIARCKAYIDKQIAIRVAQAGTKIYNLIVGGKLNQDFPFWSGAYISSWNYNFGSIDSSYSQIPTNTSGTPNIRHQRPRPQAILPNLSSPYTTLYISNSIPYAGKVEFQGTPNHAEPWKVAMNAVNAFKYGV